MAAPSPKNKRVDSRRDQLLGDLATHALTADTQAARDTIARLLSDTRDGRLVSDSLAQTLAKGVADFDVRPRQQLRPRRAAALRRVADEVPSDLVSVRHPPVPTLILPPPTWARLTTLLTEHRRIDRLRAAGLHPTSKVLLTGPPGVGKTLTAEWLAASLGLPLARVEPALVMSSLLGESARNLRQALDWARHVPCVLLIDEFDAFAKRRDDKSDIGELKRLVNMLLLELDGWPPTTLLVAATNHPHLLDPAMRRRFDLVLELPLPDSNARLALLQSLAKGHHQDVPPEILRLLAETTDGRSGSDLETLFTDAVRRAIVNDASVEHLLVDAVRPPDGKSRDETRVRALFCAVAHDHVGMSNRRLAALLNISNSTASELVRAGKAILEEPAQEQTVD